MSDAETAAALETPAERGKRAAGEAAAALVETGMLVGLGTGSTTRHAVAALGRRVQREGLKVVGVPTSIATEVQARALGIPLADPSGTMLDLAFDGADEVEIGTLRLIKGLGGALLREKIVAQSSRRFVVVADDSKLVRVLGSRAPLPVEVTHFGHAATKHRLAALGGAPVLRMAPGGEAFVTDGGNLIYDCPGFAPISDPFTLQRSLRAIAGVLESGLFLAMAERAIIGQADGATRTLIPE